MACTGRRRVRGADLFKPLTRRRQWDESETTRSSAEEGECKCAVGRVVQRKREARTCTTSLNEVRRARGSEGKRVGREQLHKTQESSHETGAPREREGGGGNAGTEQERGSHKREPTMGKRG
jgi:hypothetical protein